MHWIKKPFQWIADHLCLEDLLHNKGGNYIAAILLLVLFKLFGNIVIALIASLVLTIAIGYFVKEVLIDEKIAGGKASMRDAIHTAIGAVEVIIFTIILLLL